MLIKTEHFCYLRDITLRPDRVIVLRPASFSRRTELFPSCFYHINLRFVPSRRHRRRPDVVSNTRVISRSHAFVSFSVLQFPSRAPWPHYTRSSYSPSTVCLCSARRRSCRRTARATMVRPAPCTWAATRPRAYTLAARGRSKANRRWSSCTGTCIPLVNYRSNAIDDLISGLEFVERFNIVDVQNFERFWFTFNQMSRDYLFHNCLDACRRQMLLFSF